MSGRGAESGKKRGAAQVRQCKWAVAKGQGGG